MFLDKILTLALGAIFLVALSCEGPVAEQGTAASLPKKQTLQHEPAFWDYAASSNMLQVEIGRVAAEKGSSAQIRSIAAGAAAYHGQALEGLKKLTLQYRSIQLPDSLTGADRRLVEEFKLLEGEELDTRFRDFVVSTHNAQLGRYEEALVKAEDQQTRDWIMDMRKHLQEEISTIAAAETTDVAEEEV